MKRRFFNLFFTIALLTAALSSCAVGRPLARTPADNNQTYKVEYLFEHDGCRVYRFYDDGKYVYFTNCTGNVTTATSDSVKVYMQTITKGE